MVIKHRWHLIMKWLRPWLAWGFVGAWYGLIFWFSDQPKLPSFDHNWLDFIWFKSGHIVVYATLGFSLWRAWNLTIPQKSQRWILTLTLLSVLFLALHDEWHQSLVPGRTPSLRDVGIDLTGAGMALLIATWCQKHGVQSGQDGV